MVLIALENIRKPNRVQKDTSGMKWSKIKLLILEVKNSNQKI